MYRTFRVRVGDFIAASTLIVALLAICSCTADVGGSGDVDHAPAVFEQADDYIYCDGLADCPMVALCHMWWCHPVRDEPNPDGRWGVCRIDRLADGEPCADDTGHCMLGQCKPSRQ